VDCGLDTCVADELRGCVPSGKYVLLSHYVTYFHNENQEIFASDTTQNYQYRQCLFHEELLYYCAYV